MFDKKIPLIRQKTVFWIRKSLLLGIVKMIYIILTIGFLTVVANGGDCFGREPSQ